MTLHWLESLQYFWQFSCRQFMAPVWCGSNFSNVLFKLLLQIDILSTASEMGLRWAPQDLIDNNSTLVEIMVLYCKVTSHFLSQCWPRSIWPNDITRRQWVSHEWWPPTHLIRSLLECGLSRCTLALICLHYCSWSMFVYKYIIILQAHYADYRQYSDSAYRGMLHGEDRFSNGRIFWRYANLMVI